MYTYLFEIRDKNTMEVIWSLSFPVDEALFKSVLAAMLKYYEKRLGKVDVISTVNGFTYETLSNKMIEIDQSTLPHRSDIPVIPQETAETPTKSRLSQFLDKIYRII